MIPAAWSSFPDTGLKRTVAVKSANNLSPSRIAGKSAVAEWQSTFGDDGASVSARTSQVPENTSAPAGSLPAVSLSKVHSTVWPAGAFASLDWYLTCGVPPQPVTAIRITAHAARDCCTFIAMPRRVEETGPCQLC